MMARFPLFTTNDPTVEATRSSLTGVRRSPEDLQHRQARWAFDEALAPSHERWREKNWYYHDAIVQWCRHMIPPGSSVMEVGCATGHLLAALRPRRGVGIDWSQAMIARARARHPHLTFEVGEVEDCRPSGAPFDYVILSDLVNVLDDVQQALTVLHRVTHPRSRILVTSFNPLWEPVLRLAERLGLKEPQPLANWIPLPDLENLFALAGHEVVNRGYRLLLPVWIPGLSWVCNRVLARLPGLQQLCMVHVLVARPRRSLEPEAVSYACSVVVPCRNERGMIEDIVQRVPTLGVRTELIFVEGHSTDGTAEEICRVVQAYPDKAIRLISQGEGRGKGDAVRQGFQAATSEVLMIFDADLTTPPEDLPKFWEALVSGQGELVIGSRLVYPMEEGAMRFLNRLGNQLFSAVFTYLLGQRFRDTLCGTKALLRRDYERIAAQRLYFGEDDPFGDFDLLFGAAKLQLKIIEIPLRYRNRVYGTTNIQRFRDGWLLLKMCLVAMRKLKFV